jgi:hypothetical protein
MTVLAIVAALRVASALELRRSLDEGAAADARPSVGVFAGAALAALEANGLSLASVLGARGATGEELAREPVYASLVAELASDLAEVRARPKVGGIYAPNRAFDARWLTDPRAHFELVGVVERLDRRVLEPGCGETRLVYRLALTPERRPVTRLPMTVNVVLPQPDDGAQCRSIAAAWNTLPVRGEERIRAVLALVRRFTPRKIEIDLQTLHGPAFRPNQDDHAEYLLRAFDIVGSSVRPRPLVNTPRADLSDGERAELSTWVRDHFDEIDRGTWVLPERFLAMRAVSFAPRGLAREGNRPFANVLRADAPALGDLPYARAAVVRSQAALVRRLDEGSCQGCHASRSIAGFHLLGEERDLSATFNSVVTGRSGHLEDDLAWRQRDLTSVASGVGELAVRPMPERARVAGWGTPCGLGDPGFSDWQCPAGLECRDLNHDLLGTCMPPSPAAGDACEKARLQRRESADGDDVDYEPRLACEVKGGPATIDGCSPGPYGFPGGMCSEPCSTLGERQGDTVCADLPATGYETECFLSREPIERCLARHSTRRRVRSCDSEHPCRHDFLCARVPGTDTRTGACVPPYFVFQARVDGPVTDR